MNGLPSRPPAHVLSLGFPWGYQEGRVPPRALLAAVCLLLGTPASAADLFVKTSIPGWPRIPAYAVLSSWADYDGDGLLDVFVGQTKTASVTGVTTNLLYRNNGDGSFSQKLPAEVGAVAGDEVLGEGHWVDVNNDGAPDLWVMAYDLSSNPAAVAGPLYLNRRDGTFASVAAGALTQPRLPSGNSTWADYDNDGLLDVFIPMGWWIWPTQTNALLHGRADGTFEGITTGPVVTDESLAANDSLWSDLDHDGDVDLLVANNRKPPLYYRNEGRGRFTRMTASVLEEIVNAAFHHLSADLDQDGDLDVIVRGWTTRVFFNDGNGGFVFSQALAEEGAQAPLLGDYDNDGDLDLLLSTINPFQSLLFLYRNNGAGRFTRVSEAFTRAEAGWTLGTWVDYDNNGYLDLFVGQSSESNPPIWLFRNQGNGNHWLKFRLAGSHSNRSAIGAKVRIRATLGGRSVWQMREILGSLAAEDGGRAHFGLGDAAKAEEVRIEWPSGNVQTLTDVAVDQILTVTEPLFFRPEHPVVTLHGTVTVTNLTAATARQWYFDNALLVGQTNRILTLTHVLPDQAGRYSMVAQTGAGPVTNHIHVRVETQFTKILDGEIVDEKRDNALGNWFDANNDGLLDVFVQEGGGGGSSLFLGRGGDAFQKVLDIPAIHRATSAGFSAVADFDNNGHVDLFIPRRGAPDDLLRNDGQGMLTRVDAAVFNAPRGSSFCGAWGDYDRDGRLDLLVGRGDSGRNALYRNEPGDTFRDVGTQEVGDLLNSRQATWECSWVDYNRDGAPDAAMVVSDRILLYRNNRDGTFSQVDAGSLSAVRHPFGEMWADYDNDGYLDVLTGKDTYDGAVTVLHRNLRGVTFQNMTAAAGIQFVGDSSFGAWGDYDNDGHLDLLLTGFTSKGYLYRNRGDGTFQSVDVANLLTDGDARFAATWVDYNNDGFLDLFQACGGFNFTTANQLFRNNGNGNRWLKVKLVGTVSNRDGIGAKVRLSATIGGRTFTQMREISGNAFGLPLLGHFGLGDATHATTVRIEWPSGIVQELAQVAANQALTITEPALIQLTSQVGTDGIRIECRGAANETYEIRTSTDLQTWSPWATITTDATGLAVTRVGTEDAVRFYRAVKK